MAEEIERKFLVKGPFKKLAKKSIRIRQAYISTEPVRTIRIRITGEKGILTFKSVAGQSSFTRKEWEFEIPLKDAEEMLKICLPGIIDKTRYLVPVGIHTWEVDLFHGKNEGLIIAEIELRSEGEKFEKPAWIGEEVTGNPKYYNSNLI
jgi:adenylate cyclase